MSVQSRGVPTYPPLFFPIAYYMTDIMLAKLSHMRLVTQWDYATKVPGQVPARLQKHMRWERLWVIVIMYHRGHGYMAPHRLHVIITRMTATSYVMFLG